MNGCAAKLWEKIACENRGAIARDENAVLVFYLHNQVIDTVATDVFDVGQELVARGITESCG